jgi:taurine dioxygenase
MLHALEIPPAGGNTWFCGMQAACEALPAHLLRRIEGRRIKHDGTYNSGGYLRQGVTPTDDPLQAPGAWHPAILKHPANGRPTLYFGRRRNSYVEGLSREQSDDLLDALWAHATEPRFLYEHVWRPGDLVMWDNRSTMHRRDPFDGRHGASSHPDQGQRRPVAFAA